MTDQNTSQATPASEDDPIDSLEHGMFSTLQSAFECGYACCQAGLNIEAALERFHKIVENRKP